MPSLSILFASVEVCILPLSPPSTIAPILLPIVDSRVNLEDERAITNTMEGIGDFFNISNSSGFKNGNHLLPNSRAWKHIEDLEVMGGTLICRWREWWLGVCYFVSAMIGIPLDQIRDEDVMEAIKYQGSIDVLRRRMGLDHAIQNWIVFASIEDNVEKRVLSKIWSYFNSNVFALIMVDFSLIRKALRAIKAIDGFGIFKNIIS